MNGTVFGILFGVGATIAAFSTFKPGMNPLLTTTQTTAPQAITIEQIRAKAHMATAEFIGQVTVPAKHATQFLIFTQNSEMILLAPVRVIAGMDMSKATLTNGELQLPPVQILDAAVKVEQISIPNYRKDLFAPDEFPRLQTQAQVDALAAGVKSACENGVLQLASDRAQQFFTTWLAGANITVVSNPPGACEYPPIQPPKE